MIDATTETAGGHRGRSVVAHLARFAAAVLLPLLLAVGAMMWWSVRDEQARIDDTVRRIAREIAADLDSDLTGIYSMLEALAGSPSFSADDSSGIREQAETLARLQAISVAVRRPDGTVLFATGGFRPPVGLSQTHHKVLATRSPAVSGLIRNEAPEPPVYLVVAPVLRGDAAIALIEAALPTERAHRLLKAALPSSFWAASFMDTTGVLVTRSRNAESSTGAPATEELKRAAVGETGTWLGPSHEGNQLLGGYALSHATGWYAAVGVDRSMLSAPLMRSALQWLILLMGATLLSATLAFLFGRRIAGPVLDLAALARGRPQRSAMTYPGGGLLEANVAATALATAAAQIRERGEKLALAAAQFRTTAETVPGLVWVTTGEGMNSFVNRGFCDYTGRKPEALFGDAWLDLVHPEDLSVNMDLWRRAVEAGEPFQSQYRFRRHDGAWRWHLAKTMPQKDASGAITQWVGIATDIDDMLRTRAELEQRVAAAIAERNEIWLLTPDLLGVGDMNGHWRSVNPAWTDVLGYETDEILRMTPCELVHDDDKGIARAMGERLAAGEAVRGVEYRFRSRDRGYLWLSWTAIARRGLVYVVGRDVTMQKEAAERLRAAQDALHQTQKLETLGQLTGGVAHDFNNLLAAILSNLDLARKKTSLEPEVAKHIDNAIRGAERGATLTNRLLAFARRQELKAQPVDANALMAGMGELLVRSLGPTISMRMDLPAEAPIAQVDPHQLELALLNLAVNARDAMPAGGELTLSLGRVRLEAGNPDALPAGDYVCIAVTDTGAGMDDETLRRAVEPFFTTKELGQGTGLGLSMVQGLMKQSGGTMRLESRKGEGTRATLLLPDAQAVPRNDDAPAAESPAGRTDPPLSVLVVDDDPLVAMGTVAMLEDLGHSVQEASSGLEAIGLLEGGDRIDLVITDQAMPGMTGSELAEKIRSLHPGLPVILSTGYADFSGMPGPMDGSRGLPKLSKPFRQHALAEAIAEAVPGRR